MTYEEAITTLRSTYIDIHGGDCAHLNYSHAISMAFEALEKVMRDSATWIPVTWHYITEEEREEDGWLEDITYCLDCTLPCDGDEILITTEHRGERYVSADICGIDDAYYLDSGTDWRGVIAWMPLPKPYKERNNE